MADSTADTDNAGAIGGHSRRVLITGANGTIGRYVVPHLARDYDLLLAHRSDHHTEQIASYGELLTLDLGDLEAVRAACRGVDTVCHLAASAAPDTPWRQVCDNNITATYHVYAAAIDADCRRVVFASSIHAVSGYPPGRQVRPGDAVNPGDLYGVSKCFGEAMARYAAVQHGLSSICIRIGAFQPRARASSGEQTGLMNAFLSRRDCCQLIRLALADETTHFAIVHGLSGNRFNRLDITGTEELLGYRPDDDFTELDPELERLQLADSVQPHDERHSGKPGGMREDLRSD